MQNLAISFDVNYPNPPHILPIDDRLPIDRSVGGRGVSMAFIDSGFAPHPDIASRIKRYVDASTLHIREFKSVSQTDVFSWHGQMTSFAAAADGGLSGGRYRGIAPEAELVLIRITSPTGTLREHDMWRGIDWLCHRHHQLGIRVVNISVGGDDPSADPNHTLHRAVKRLTDEGVVVVVAAGNSGSRSLLPPASSPSAIVVGGYDDQNSANRAEWFAYNSNYGQAYDGSVKPDVIAPAAWLPSPILQGSDMQRDARWLAPLLYQHDVQAQLPEIIRQGYAEMHMAGQAEQLPLYRIKRILQERIYKHKLIDMHHQHVDGTSVAAPLVAAVVAQMLEVNPQLSPKDVKRILKETALPLHNMPLEQQGAGIINPLEAVRAAKP